ncbi:DUF6191 domain-containing protein [Streptomyces sp. Je 1-332]|uniref:DUF6191 domain-containing protein n=1 Tax=Streptomyces sp. Je 1-332 TaxID=3231270 RepID=UPI003457FED1
MFNPIELFQPGRKHTHDEQKRLELSRIDVADGDPGRGPIDLTSGKVVVRVPQQAEAEAAREQEQEQEQGQEPEQQEPGLVPEPDPVVDAADAEPGSAPGTAHSPEKRPARPVTRKP